jgi:hypothetical protein
MRASIVGDSYSSDRLSPASIPVIFFPDQICRRVATKRKRADGAELAGIVVIRSAIIPLRS